MPKRSDQDAYRWLGKSLISIGTWLQRLGISITKYGKRLIDISIAKQSTSRIYSYKTGAAKSSEAPLIAIDEIYGVVAYPNPEIQDALRFHKGQTLHVVCDGSANTENAVYSWACAFLKDEDLIITLSGSVITARRKDKSKKYLNTLLASELTGPLVAIHEARLAQIKRLFVHYDWSGINPKDKSNTNCKRLEVHEYNRMLKRERQGIDVVFCKVASKNNIAHKHAKLERRAAEAKLGIPCSGHV